MARPSQSAERRRQLIPEIARAFAGLGYRHTTTALLARRCKVRENILYRLWTDKKAMFIASIDHVYELSTEVWQEVLEADQTGADAAEVLLRYEARHHGEFGFYRIVFAGLSEAEDPEIRRALGSMFSRFHQFVHRLIAAHRRHRGVQTSPDAALSAWAFLGLGTLVNISRELGLLTPARRARLMREVGQLLLEGGAQPASRPR